MDQTKDVNWKKSFYSDLLACKSMQNSIRQRKSLPEAWERRGNEKRWFGKVNKTKYSFLAELISCLSFNLTASEHLGRSHVSSWAAGTETEENACIRAECCRSPGRGRGRQREPGREKAKWWELEQQQLLLARHCSCPGIGSAASTHLQRCRCLRFKSPRRPVVLPGATVVLFFLWRTSVWGLCSFLWTERGNSCHYFVPSLEADRGSGKK